MGIESILFLIGRAVFGGYFLFNAYNHLVHTKHLAGYAQFKGVPSPMFAIFGSGLLLLIGGLSYLTGSYMQWGGIALLAFLVPVTFKMHAFWKEQDPQQRMTERVAFLKNIALMAAVLMTF